MQNTSEENLRQQSLPSSMNLVMIQLAVLDYGHKKNLFFKKFKKPVQSALRYFSKTIKMKSNTTSIG